MRILGRKSQGMWLAGQGPPRLCAVGPGAPGHSWLSRDAPAPSRTSGWSGGQRSPASHCDQTEGQPALVPVPFPAFSSHSRYKQGLLLVQTWILQQYETRRKLHWMQNIQFLKLFFQRGEEIGFYWQSFDVSQIWGFCFTWLLSSSSWFIFLRLWIEPDNGCENPSSDRRAQQVVARKAVATSHGVCESDNDSTMPATCSETRGAAGEKPSSEGPAPSAGSVSGRGSENR